MRLNVTERFRLAEAIRVPLPWADGVVVTVKWIGNPAFRKHLEAANAGGSIGEQLKALRFKAAAEAAAKAGRRRGGERKKFIDQLEPDIFAELLRSADLEIGADGITDEAVVDHLIADVEGLLDVDTDPPTPVEWSRQVGLELLAQRDPIPDDVSIPAAFGEDPFEVGAGTPIGEAIKFWVVWRAGEAQAFRQAELERAGKV